ncbi:sugar ABC transporter ATP-binding protein [Luethyella okanaganae]|uniref:Sugar ABC transporter ATP-binding protein n=1 Tax=Luethyella okanaganae TaxID=69372 RepID=A0ABW1VGA9_9MICO
MTAHNTAALQRPAGSSHFRQDTAPVTFVVDGVTKSYGPVAALKAVTLSLRPGEVHALLGQNGSGKSSMVKIISGTTPPTAGRVSANGEAIKRGDVRASRGAGIVTVFQELSILPSLTVAENILLGNYPTSMLGTIRRGELHKRAAAVLERFNIVLPLSAPCRTLSLSELQLVEIARALSTSPKLLILDEATSSLDKPDADNLLRISREIAGAGRSVLFVSHRMDEVFAVADTISVLTDGTLVASGAASETTRSILLEQLAGKSLQPLQRLAAAVTTATREVVLDATVPGLGAGAKALGVSVRAGEIVGFAGLQGHGQKEAMRILAGIGHTRGVRISVQGRRVSHPSTHNLVRRGVSYVPEDRGTEGLLLGHSVRTNATLSSLHRLKRWGFLSAASERSSTAEIINMLSVRARSQNVAVDTLSGGNQQKVLIGRALMVRPIVILLDDPTRGIDPGAKADIYETLRALAAQGIGVIFNSTELPEVVGLCDRVLVFHDNHVARELIGDQITEAAILTSMLGA